MTDTATKCTICASEPSPGFYTGCLIADGHGDGRWNCDGKGNLTRPDRRACERYEKCEEGTIECHCLAAVTAGDRAMVADDQTGAKS